MAASLLVTACKSADGGEFVGDGGVDGSVAACDAGTWNHDGNMATACVAWTDCAVGTYVSTPGSITNDRVCTPCAAGSFSGTANASTCTSHATCAAGTSVAVEGTATADRTCAACASGSFSTTTNAASCAAWTDCAAGTFVSVAPTSATDRTCTACDDGFYSTAPNSGACAPVGTCAPGEYETAAATSSSPQQCAACAAGNYCAGGTAAPVPCATGTWDDDANPASDCVAWTQCSAGFSVTTDGSATTDRTCGVCASGAFSTATNATGCTGWTDCVAGQFVGIAGSTTADQVCGTCPSGTFSTTTNAALCTAWTDCVAGQFVAIAGTASNDQTCTACASGTFSLSANAVSCMPDGSCAAGFVKTADGTSTSDVTCGPCEAGTFCAGGDAPKVACAPGTWDNDGSAASDCVAWTVCSAGFGPMTDGSATTDRTCAACQPGYPAGVCGIDLAIYGNPGGGASYPDACPAGQAMIGVNGSVGGSFDQIQVVCGALAVRPDHSVAVSAGTTLPMRGANPNPPVSASCPTDQMVVGFAGRSGALLDQLTLYCAPATATAVASGYTLSLGSPSPLGAIGGYGGNPFPATLCPRNETAVGAHIRAGGSVDAFALTCGTPVVP